MAKKVVPLPRRCAMPTNTVSEQRVTIRLGKQRYELAITCPASVIPHETEPAGRVIKTKFISPPTAGGTGRVHRRLAGVLGWWLGSREGILRRDGESAR